MILGFPNSGKTHYFGQFFVRATKLDTCNLKIRKDIGAPSDLTILKDFFLYLAQGKLAPRTPTNTFGNLELPLVNELGKRIDLSWPDYAGEQLKSIFLNRTINQEWIQSLKESSGWILTIRLDEEIVIDDRLHTLSSQNNQSNSILETSLPETNRLESMWNANSKWIETLQIILHGCNISIHSPNRLPKVAVFLTCYDRYGSTNCTPRQTLINKLPLLDDFLHSVWNDKLISIWGVSSLGKDLDDKGADDLFVDEGAEAQGWVVKPNGEESSDLTLPISWLIG